MPLFGAGAFSLIVLALWIFCLVDVFTSVEGTTRNLPKIGWIFVVLFLPLVGSILWLVAGRPDSGYREPPSRSRYPEYDRPGRFAATNPDDDEDFLRQCRERAEEQRRQAKLNQREQDES
ncbi:PLD nuclease N-terminal domain-containing protein [Actinocrispum wychmicini]|uniref:Phospholipase D-like protein n=1 Tax=Actinocrispum wychmicini TaxID=1213861 RepID=A0A4R2ITT2_9PSEU|nr:PLD nuclease N-terminal domain-containing protein [Actinocrispum wychmicini]TCO48991.1 phospholipase D-like protein [Actinocrispum wychmicini]